MSLFPRHWRRPALPTPLAATTALPHDQYDALQVALKAMVRQRARRRVALVDEALQSLVPRRPNVEGAMNTLLDLRADLTRDLDDADLATTVVAQ